MASDTFNVSDGAKNWIEHVAVMRPEQRNRPNKKPPGIIFRPSPEVV